MNGVPKSRFSGLVIIIILFLILCMGLFTVFSRYSNEQRLIKRGFFTLQQNAASVQSKIEVISITYNAKLKNPKQIHLGGRHIIVKVDKDRKEFRSSDSIIINDTMTITGGFFSDILDKAFFDEYVVFDSNQLLYKSFEAEVLEQDRYLEALRKNFYFPGSYRIFSAKKDSVLMRSTWNTGFIAKTIINYNKYYQFVYPVKINNNTWYISGLLTNQNYLDKKRHVETWILIFIGILLIFTLFSFQFIKLFLLSKTERINTSDVVFICFSISGIACIITILILNTYTLAGIKLNTEKQLNNLSDSIKNNFITELNLMYKTVESYEKAKKSSLPVVSHILTDTGLRENNYEMMKAIGDYPYFKGLFASNHGMTDSILTTWKSDTKSRISYRQYFQKKDEWLLPGNDEEKRFRLQSIYSNTSGDVSAVLAKPAFSRSDVVYCISSPMYSVINIILPPGFEFRIIGEDGIVWFHNNKKKNNRENFFDECNHNAVMLESLHNRIETFIPLKISLVNYQSHITPIGTLPLFLVTLCNTSEQNEFLSHTNYILFIFILLGIFCALVSTALFYYEKINQATSSADDTDNEPGLMWLLPDTRKKEKYIIIVGLNVLTGLFISVPYFFNGTTIIHVLLVLLTAYSFCFIYFYYLLKAHEKKAFKMSVPLTFSIIIVICNIIYCMCLTDYQWFLSFELSAIALIGIILFRRMKIELSMSSLIPARFLNNPYVPYVLFVFSWMVISCILPTILLFKVAGREEVELSAKKTQVELATKIEHKNLQIDSFYIKWIYPDAVKAVNLDNIKTDLKHKGIYLLNGSRFHMTIGYKSECSGKSPRKGYFLLNRFLRQMIRSEDIRSYQMLSRAGLDTTWYWTGGHLPGSNSDTLTLHFRSKQKNADGFYSGYQLELSTLLRNPIYVTAYTTSWLRFFQIAVFFLFFIFLYLFIRIVIRQLFILEYTDRLSIVGINSILKNGRTYLISTLGQDRIRKSFSGSHTLISQNNPKSITASKGILIIFNPFPISIAAWDPVFNALDKRIETDPENIILVSCYSPLQVSNMIEEAAQNATLRETKDSLIRLRQMLIRLFSGFEVYFTEEQDSGKLLISSQYQYLWEKCTLNEKFILSDLSLDSAINTKNRDDIRNLIGKGILEVKGKLSFVNRGFKLYIMELAGTEEFTNLEKSSKRADGWNKVKTPIYVIFGAVLLFFFFTQQDVISTISAAILSITGLLGTLLRFGLFGKSADVAK